MRAAQIDLFFSWVALKESSEVQIASVSAKP